MVSICSKHGIIKEMYNDRSEIKVENFSNLQTNQDKLEFLILLATLAPSAHNTQPWLFKIKDQSIFISANVDRKLPYSDQHHRQLFLSIGAAISNLMHAADYYGLKYEIQYSEPVTDVSIAVISFLSLEPTNINIKGLRSIVTRKTNRLPFLNKDIDQNILDQLQTVCISDSKVIFIQDKEKQLELQKIITDSVDTAFSDKKFTNELSHWIKPSSSKYRDGMPGYTIGVPKLLSFLLPFMIRNFNLRGMQKKMHLDWLRNSSVYGAILTKGDSSRSWLDAGISFENIALSAEQLDLKIGIIGAPIEIGEYYKNIQQALSTTDRPQMFFRIGYAKDMPHFSPRINYKETIIH